MVNPDGHVRRDDLARNLLMPLLQVQYVVFAIGATLGADSNLN